MALMPMIWEYKPLKTTEEMRHQSEYSWVLPLCVELLLKNFFQ